MPAMLSRLLHAILPLVLACCVSGAARPLPLPDLDPARRGSLLAWLQANGRAPENYVLARFETKDVVCLGEYHRIRHDVEFVQEVIRRMPAAGVEVFAWEADRARPAGTPTLRVLGMGDSPDWSLIRRPEDWDNGAIRRAVWRGGGERFWAQAILKEVERGRKVLVHCGIHHAFSAFGQPIVVDGRFVRFEDDRMGQHLRAALGDRVATISLHAPWPGRAGYDADDVRPVEGVIDALLAQLPPDRRRFAFHTRGTPLGELPARDAVYSQGGEAFTLADFCDGYVVLAAFDDFKGVRVIPGFINKGNLERARLGMPNPLCRTWSAGKLMRDMARDADASRFHPLRAKGAPVARTAQP
ncbi:MAG: hypothetical protein Q8O14_13930 [bacterium]|nr:hypothetical protein [bacterium]